MIENLYLSKSSVETWKQCKFKFQNRYINKLQVSSSENDAAKFGILIHTVLEKYFKSKKTENLIDLYKYEFKDSGVESHELFITGISMISDYAKDSETGAKILDMELPFQLYLDNGVPIKGFIDRIEEVDDETISIIDYKTGYSQPLTEKQLSSDLQLAIYTMAVKQLYPQYKKVKASLYYLHYGKVSTEISDENLNAIKEYLAIVYNRITKVIESKEDLLPTINSYCSFCDYKAICPAFQETVKTEELSLTGNLNALIAPEKGIIVDIEKLDKFLDMIVNKQKLLKKIEVEAKTFIKKYIEENGGDSKKAKIGNTFYSLNSKKYTTYDVRTLVKLCKEKGIDPIPLLSANKADVDNLFYGDKESMELLKSNAKINFSEGYIK